MTPLLISHIGLWHFWPFLNSLTYELNQLKWYQITCTRAADCYASKSTSEKYRGIRLEHFFSICRNHSFTRVHPYQIIRLEYNFATKILHLFNIKNNKSIFTRFYSDYIFRIDTFLKHSAIVFLSNHVCSLIFRVVKLIISSLYSIHKNKPERNHKSDNIANPTLFFDPSNRIIGSFFNFGQILLLIWLFLPYFVLKVFFQVSKWEWNFINKFDIIYVV